MQSKKKRLLELSGRDLWRGIDWDFIHMKQHFDAIQRSGTRYVATEGDIIRFLTKSETIPGHEWKQWIRLVELKEVITDPDITLKDKVLLALSGDLHVHCNCPAFLYWGYNYIVTQLNAGIVPEIRAPKIRNPRMRGDVCKHLALVLRVLPFWWAEIVRDLRKQGYHLYTREEREKEMMSKGQPESRKEKVRKEKEAEDLVRGKRTWPSFQRLVEEAQNSALR